MVDIELYKFTKKIVFSKLLCFGFFPEDALSLLSSGQFGQYIINNEDIVSDLIATEQKTKYCQFKLTRNNNSPRYLGIVHPYQYIKLAKAIRDSWNKITKQLDRVGADNTTASIIKPQLDNKNGRLVSIKSGKTYDPEEQTITDNDLKKINIQIGSKYRVKADIANFYPSIYTHSVTWVSAGREAGFNKRGQVDIFNNIDRILGACQDKETIGLPVGPDTSAIIAEYILSGVDKQIKKYTFLRFIDDYECYCKTYDQAEQFIIDLSSALDSYRLRLNSKKTEITQSPFPINPPWLTSIKLLESLVSDVVEKQHVDRIISFLDNAIVMTNKYPDGSPLKYTLKILSNHIYNDVNTYLTIAKYIFHITTQYPYLISTCGKFITIGYNQFPESKKKLDKCVASFLNMIIDMHSPYKRSDALTWSMAIANKFNVIISDSSIDKIIRSEDCISTLFSYIYEHSHKVSLSKYPEKDEDMSWWIYSYEKHFAEGTKYKIKNPINNFLSTLLKNNISFIKPSLDIEQ